MIKIWKDNYQSLIMIISSLIIIVCVCIFPTFAHYGKDSTGQNNSITTGTVSMTLTQSSDTFSSLFYETLEDNEGILSNYYEFVVTAETSEAIDAGYYIYLTEITGNTINKSNIKLYLTEVNNNIESVVFTPKLASNCTPFNLSTLTRDNSSTKFFLNNDTFHFSTGGAKTKTYRLRIWLDSSYEFNSNNENNNSSHSASINGETFAIKINLYGVQGTTSIIS